MIRIRFHVRDGHGTKTASRVVGTAAFLSEYQAQDSPADGVEHPVIGTHVCTRCGLCFVGCPDGAIALDAEVFPILDYDHCNGRVILPSNLSTPDQYEYDYQSTTKAQFTGRLSPAL